MWRRCADVLSKSEQMAKKKGLKQRMMSHKEQK